MKNQWMAYVIVAVVSALAGVAIAGRPNTVGTDATIVVPATPATTTTLAPAATTEPPVESDPVVTDTTTTTSTQPSESTTTTTTLVDFPVVAREELVVVSINGAGTAGLATRIREELRDLGYAAARATDGTVLVDETVVYFYPLLENEARSVATDLGLDPDGVLPVDEAPEFGQLEGDHVAVYLGRDQS